MKRKDETFNPTAVIHGGTKTQRIPALDGMFGTLNKRCKLSDLATYVSNVGNLQERVLSMTYSKNKGQFEISEGNVIRSIVTNYSVKYKGARPVLLTKISEGKREGRTSLCMVCKSALPELSPYRKLIAHISQIDVGKVYSVKEVFSDHLTAGNLFLGLQNGICKQRTNVMKAMKSLGETDGTLLVAFDGDGYPLGRKVHAPS